MLFKYNNACYKIADTNVLHYTKQSLTNWPLWAACFKPIRLENDNDVLGLNP